MIKSKFIIDVVELLVLGHKDEEKLKSQILLLTDTEYDYTGVGLYLTFSRADEIINYRIDYKVIEIHDVNIKSDELNEYGAYAVLRTEDGIIDFLEICTYHGPYPQRDLTNYELVKKEVFTRTHGSMSLPLPGVFTKKPTALNDDGDNTNIG